jgi:hypothetical protein
MPSECCLLFSGLADSGDFLARYSLATFLTLELHDEAFSDLGAWHNRASCWWLTSLGNGANEFLRSLIYPIISQGEIC